MVKPRIPTNIKLLAVKYYKNNNLSFEKVAEILIQGDREELFTTNYWLVC